MLINHVIVKSKLTLWIILPAVLASLPSIGVANEKNANQHAFQIAERQPKLKKLFEKLENEAQSIIDPNLRKDALAVLHHPVFGVLLKSRSHEAEIIQNLKQEKLIDFTNTPPSIFPKGEPMPFLAAPGSVWNSHHSYPGGLVYHTYTNLSLGLKYALVYQDVYDVKLRKDTLRFAAIFHDSAKTTTLSWNSDGSCTSEEIQIAGTSAHHIIAIAEAIFRKYPPDLIVTIASAHTPPATGIAARELINYLKAGAILAEAPYTAAGLTRNGKALTSRPSIEAFVNHLDDHDYLLTENSILAVDESIKKTLEESNSQRDYWKRNEILSRQGDLPLYQNSLTH